MAIPAGAEIAGIIGMFLIVPFLGVIAVSWRTVVHMFDPVDPGAVDAGSVTTEPDPVTNDPVVTPPSPQPIN
jgi:hypothetical protein